jgi:hypothetical protein
MCFVWISEQTAIISLYSINWLVCITETECVYCAVRTGCLNGIQVQLIHHCPMLISMDASFSRRTNPQSQVTNQNAMIVPKSRSALQTSTFTFLLLFKRLTSTVSYIISYHLFSFRKSLEDNIIHMDVEIVIFVGSKGWHHHSVYNNHMVI